MRSLHRVVASLGALCVGASLLGAGSTLPPPGARTYTGTLDPVYWRRLLPPGYVVQPFEQWAISKPGRPPVAMDVSAVLSQADAAANREVRAYGRYRTGTTGGGVAVRYMVVTHIDIIR